MSYWLVSLFRPEPGSSRRHKPRLVVSLVPGDWIVHLLRKWMGYVRLSMNFATRNPLAYGFNKCIFLLMANIHTKCLSTKEVNQFIRQRGERYSILRCQNSGVVPTLGNFGSALEYEYMSSSTVSMTVKCNGYNTSNSIVFIWSSSCGVWTVTTIAWIVTNF